MAAYVRRAKTLLGYAEENQRQKEFEGYIPTVSDAHLETSDLFSSQTQSLETNTYSAFGITLKLLEQELSAFPFISQLSEHFTMNHRELI